MVCKWDTLPETNIAPDNRPLEKEIPNLETTIFRGYVSFRVRISVSHLGIIVSFDISAICK